MEREEIIKKLTAIFRTVFGNENLVLEDSMTPNDIDNWVSLTHMQMTNAVQEEFGIKFSIMDQVKLMRVESIINVIEAKLAQK